MSIHAEEANEKNIIFDTQSVYFNENLSNGSRVMALNKVVLYKSNNCTS